MHRERGVYQTIKNMKEIIKLKNFGLRIGDKIYATRKQVQELYDVPQNTLADNINRLKEDRLINGTEIRSVALDRRKRMQEVFTLEETIAIGLRLRSDTAIRLQRYATRLITEKMDGLIEEKRMLELELSFAWNKSDNDDLYR